MWVKICGITSHRDALAAVDMGADALGLNFYPPSPRFLNPLDAMNVCKKIENRAAMVGVFVNPDIRTVVETVRQVRLNGVQFHGDESISQLEDFQQQCPEAFLIRAFRLNATTIESVYQAVCDMYDQGVKLKAVLLDAFVPGHFGGTGHLVDVETVNRLRKRLHCAGIAEPDTSSASGAPQVDVAGRPLRIILAGGLTPDNVGAAIRAANPWGVDTASGVEQTPGCKDHSRVQRFISAARMS